jgi:hypothetical protein
LGTSGMLGGAVVGALAKTLAGGGAVWESALTERRKVSTLAVNDRKIPSLSACALLAASRSAVSSRLICMACCHSSSE